jgi:hypothetical protein
LRLRQRQITLLQFELAVNKGCSTIQKNIHSHYISYNFSALDLLVNQKHLLNGRESLRSLKLVTRNAYRQAPREMIAFRERWNDEMNSRFGIQFKVTGF